MRNRVVVVRLLASGAAAACASLLFAGLSEAAADTGVVTVRPPAAARVATGPGVVTVTQPWVAPASRGGTTGAYFVLRSSRPARVVAASSPRGTASLMQGRQPVAEIALPAGEPVAFTAAGAHVALRGVGRALAMGDRVPVTLTLRNDDGSMLPIEVNAEVRRRSPIDDERRAHRVVPASAGPVPAQPGRGVQPR
jgi:copper(I)-binding protein